MFIGLCVKKKDVIVVMLKYKILYFVMYVVIDDIDFYGDFSMKGFIVLVKFGFECNGILMVEEVRGMELNVEFVVLSCCEMGLGKVIGDGVLGKF